MVNFGQTAQNSWDVEIPLNDYIVMQIRKKPKIFYKEDFLLWCYQRGEINYRDALIYFEENKSIGLWTHYKRIIKDDGIIILFGNGMFTTKLIMSNKKMWKYNLIWEKSQPTGFLNAKKMPLRNHEDICVFYRKSPTYNPQKTTGHVKKVSRIEHKISCKKSTDYGMYGLTTYDSTERYPKSIWKFAKDTQKLALHPTQKPIALFEELVKTYTNEGDVVLDSCMGSGTCGVACMNTNRRFVGIEIKEEYYMVTKNRIMDLGI